MYISELALTLSERTGIDRRVAQKFIATMTETIQNGVVNDKMVKIKGLGTFKTVEVSARESVNVNTGERVTIDSHSKLSFVADSNMRELLNKPFSQFETVVLNEGVNFDDIDTLYSDFGDEESEGSDIQESTDIPNIQDTPKTSLANATSEKPVTQEETEKQVAPATHVEDAIKHEVEQIALTETPNTAASTTEKLVEHKTEPAVEEPVAEVEEPVAEVEEPVAEVEEPVTEVENHETLGLVSESQSAVRDSEDEQKESAEDVEDDENDDDEEDDDDEDDDDDDEDDDDEDDEDDEAYESDDEEDDEAYESDDEEDNENRNHSHRWLWIALAIIASALCFVAGYFLGNHQFTVVNKPVQQQKALVTEPTGTQTVTPTDTLMNETTDSLVAETQEESRAEEVHAPQQEETEPEWKRYEEMDARVRTGAYHIIGLDRIVVVKQGETTARISRRTLGEGMECYIEVFNGIKASTPLQPGTELKIPSLQLKRAARLKLSQRQNAE